MGSLALAGVLPPPRCLETFRPEQTRGPDVAVTNPAAAPSHLRRHAGHRLLQDKVKMEKEGG